MAFTMKKRIFFLVFCLSSVTQGMYSTYFVSILTTIERLYQIQSKTAGAIMSATEIGQILGALLIAYYGGKGNKPKWIAACMTLTAIAALISTSPQFILNPTTTNAITPTTQLPYLTSDLTTTQASDIYNKDFEKVFNFPTQEQLCYITTSDPIVLNSTYSPRSASSTINLVNSNILSSSHVQKPTGAILVIFFLCLLAIGFGSTAITTLGIPFIDDIVSKEESPLYLGLTIGLKIFGPALGFLLGSFCIRLDVNTLAPSSTANDLDAYGSLAVGAWWLGLIIISLPLLILALPMYYLSRIALDSDKSESANVFQEITYQAAEDHDIGGSRDFQTHVLTSADLDVTSNRTCYSDIDSSSREVLQAKSSANQFKYNFGKNIILDRPIITRGNIFNKPKHEGGWNASCIVVDHFGGLESTSYANDEVKSLQSSSMRRSSSSSSSPPPPSTLSSSATTDQSTMNLLNSLSRLLKNRLLLLRLLSGILHILPIAGFYTFLPKYLMEQFRIAPSSASAISGLAGILFVGFGAFLGGTIIRVLNVNSKLMTKWIATSALLYALGMLILMNLGCPENHLVYHESSDFKLTDCLLNCKCSANVYSPVCANGTTYMSPCLAGCKNYSISENRIIFDECGCSSTINTQTASLSTDSEETSTGNQELHLNLNVATQGHCKHNCDNLIWYIIIFSIFTLFHASCEVGSMMFNLRCVKTSDRTLALGLITFTSSLLGTIPCSVIYGTVIDLTCIQWDNLSDPLLGDLDVTTRGACRAYKNDTFRFYLHGFTAFVMFLAFLVDCIISRRAREVDFYDENDSKQQEATVALKKSTETI